MVTKASAEDKAFWSKMCGQELTDDEVLEIRENWTRTMKLLVEQSWALRNDPDWKRQLGLSRGGVA